MLEAIDACIGVMRGTRWKLSFTTIVSLCLIQLSLGRRIAFTEFFLYPNSDLICQYDEAYGGVFIDTSELIRASAEDCLRRYVPTYCTNFEPPAYIGLRGAECFEDSEATSNVGGSYISHVTILGGVFDVGDDDSLVSTTIVENCLRMVLESDDCVDFFKMKLDEAFSEVINSNNIPQLTDLKVSFESTTPALAPTGTFDSVESGLAGSDMNKEALDEDDNSQPFTIAFGALGVAIAIAIASVLAMHRRRGNETKFSEEVSCNATRSLDDGDTDINEVAGIQDSYKDDQNKYCEAETKEEDMVPPGQSILASQLEATVTHKIELPLTEIPREAPNKPCSEDARNNSSCSDEIQPNHEATNQSMHSKTGIVTDNTINSTEYCSRYTVAADQQNPEIGIESNPIHYVVDAASPAKSQVSSPAESEASSPQLLHSTFARFFNRVETRNFAGENVLSDFEQDSAWDPDDNSLSTNDNSYVNVDQLNEAGEGRKRLLFGGVRSDDDSISDDEILDIMLNESSSSFVNEPLIKSFFGQTQRLQMEPLPIPPELKDCQRQRRSSTARLLLSPKGFI